MRLGVDKESPGFVQQVDRKHVALVPMTRHERLLFSCHADILQAREVPRD